MVWQPVRIILLFGAVAAVAASPARADCCNPAPAPCCAPAMKTIQVTECVPETYQVCRTAYKTECKQECYTAYKSVCVPECRTRTCTVYKKVPVWTEECRNVCVKVPCIEERTICKKTWTTQQVTTMVCKTVDRGHYECKEVPDHFKDFCNKLKHSCHRHDCCCECECECPCPAMKTVKCWVPCKVTEQCPVTTCKKVCVETPCKVQVTVCKTEIRQEKHKVCTFKCVPECKTETYTVNVAKCVPYQATRTVRVCVPYQETVTCTRMVSRTVCRQVPVECAPACDTCNRSHFRFSGLFHREHHESCGCGCN